MSDYGVDVLAFGPHPDDLELFCGGVLIRFADLGYRTGAVDLSLGERASNGTVEARQQEAAEASRIMGLAFRENLRLPDTFIGAEAAADTGPDSQLAKVVEVIRRRRPELVLIPWVEERHPDHSAAGLLLTRAVYFAGVRKFETNPSSERFVPRQVMHYQLRHRMPPTFVMDTSLAAERKAKAVACYGSQLVGPTPTLIGSGRAYAAIEARDRYFGSMIGATHGEALRMPNVPGIVDPLKHLRDNPFTEAHAFEPLR